MCVYVRVFRGQKRLDSLKLKLQVVLSCSVGAGN